MGEGRSKKFIKIYEEHHFNKVTFTGGSAKCYCLKPKILQLRNGSLNKGAVSRCFSATFDIAGLKPCLSTIAHTRNVPRKKVKRKIPSKILEERGIAIHFRLFFQAKIGKLEKFYLNFSSLELEFLLLA